MNKIIPFIVLSLLLGAPLSTQEIRHDVSITLKLIQVYVLDSHGKPLIDLKPEEFIITDNKSPRKITEFERHILDPRQRTEPKAFPKDTSMDMNRKFFLFFDFVNNSPKGFVKAQEAALHFIDTQLQSSDEVGVLSFSVVKGLTLHEYLTPDHKIVLRAVHALGGEGHVGRVENFESALWRELSVESALDASQSSKPIKSWAPEHTQPNLDTMDRSKRYEILIRREEQKKVTENLISKLTGLSKALRYIPGNKHLLFFSSGIPYSLIYGDDRQRFPMDSILRNQYEEMLKEMSNANTSVFCLNTESLISDVNVPSHYKGEKTLRRIALYTGGKFLGNVQNYEEAFETMQTFTGSYYILGYYINEALDGRYHQIKVEVTRPNCTVFAQKGFYNPKPFSGYSNLEKELHLIDLAFSEKSLFQDSLALPMVTVPFPLDMGTGLLLMAEIPVEIIDERNNGKLEIIFLVFDSLENVLDVRRNEVDISMLKTREAYYYSLCSLPPGGYRVRAVMRNLHTGIGAVGQIKTKIPKAGSEDLKLFPPLLLKPAKSSIFIRGFTSESIKKEFPLISYFPFDPEIHSPALDVINSGTKNLTACFHVYIKNLEKPALKFLASLVMTETGLRFELPISILSVNKDGDIGTVLAEMQVPRLPAGDYMLTLETRDVSGGRQAETSLPCKIK